MTRTDQIELMVTTLAGALLALMVLTILGLAVWGIVAPLVKTAWYYLRARRIYRKSHSLHSRINQAIAAGTASPRYQLTEGQWFYRPGHGDSYMCTAPFRIDGCILGREVWIDDRVHVVSGIEYLTQQYHAAPGDRVCITVARRAQKES